MAGRFHAKQKRFIWDVSCYVCHESVSTLVRIGKAERMSDGIAKGINDRCFVIVLPISIPIMYIKRAPFVSVL